MSFGLRRDAVKRGEYRNYTFRLPQHVPNLTFSVTADYGCVCLYASNCSERPLPRLCQWTLLVDAEKQKHGQLTVSTSEHHFVSGLYHVGLYCVADSSFSLGCFTAPLPLGVAAAKGNSLLAAEKKAQQPPPPAAQQYSPRGGSQLFPPPRATKKPFIDAGLLERTLEDRARQPRGDYPSTPSAAAGALSARSPAPKSGARPARPGDAHYDRIVGEWHRSLRDTIRSRAGGR